MKDKTKPCLGCKIFKIGIVLFIIWFLVLFFPIPYYQGRVLCKPNGVCPQQGWHLGPSLYTKLFSF